MYELDAVDPQSSDGATEDYRGPERRSRAHRWTAAFDEMDFGILLVDSSGHVRYANRIARTQMISTYPLRLVDQNIRARDPRDANQLGSALRDASQRGLRRLVMLSGEDRRVNVVVVPLAHGHGGADTDVIMMLGRGEFAAPLAVEAFARGRGLTLAETRVLVALCGGKAPRQIARESYVEISTVRSQIASIRSKTGARNLSELLGELARLPPFVGIVGRVTNGHADSEGRRIDAVEAGLQIA